MKRFGQKSNSKEKDRGAVDCVVCRPTDRLSTRGRKTQSEADPGGGVEGVATPSPLGSFQTCLVTYVYPFFIPKVILQVVI